MNTIFANTIIIAYTQFCEVLFDSFLLLGQTMASEANKKESKSERKQYLKYGDQEVQFYIKYLQRILSLEIPSVICHICCLYFGQKTEYFDNTKMGIRCKLNNSKNICTLIRNGGSTVYGNVNINTKENKYILSYKWTFKIIKKRINMFIGIDSNPRFTQVDFSNYFRNYDKFHKDIFCAYGSDGNIYDYISRDCDEYGVKWKENDIIEMIVDTQEETLSYMVNGEDQGIAMEELDFEEKTYHMAVALFYGEDEIQLIDFSVDCGN